MRPVITADEVARLDAATSVPEPVLMERAGLAVALAAARMGAGYGTRVIVLAGTGNNGGDGYVAARHLAARGAEVAVRSLGYPRGDSSTRRAMAIRAAKAGVPLAALGDPEPTDLIVDALFGVGFRGTLPEVALPWVEHEAPVLAVDVPSGLDATTGAADGPAFRAERTVTFHALKTGMLIGSGPDLCGGLDVADIGLDGERAEWLLCEDTDAEVPARPREAHKWSAGSVAVVGGSPGITGAAMLAGRSALEAGAGAVRVVVPGALRGEAAAMDPGIMTAGSGDGSIHDDAAGILSAAGDVDVLAIGPGLGDVAHEVVRDLATGWKGPLIVDADAIEALGVEGLSRAAPTVVTPHAGEFQRLTGAPASPPAAARLAEDTGAVVVLKGAPTFVMGHDRWVVTSGGPELATIGTGDVLTGMVAAFLARGLEADAAARAAAHRHGLAASDLADHATVTATGLSAAVGRFAW